MKGMMGIWAVALLLSSSLDVCAGPLYQGQGSDGVIRPNCSPTTLGQSDRSAVWAILLWKSQGFQTPVLSRDDIFCWDKYLSRVPDRKPEVYDLVVFKDGSDELTYGLVLEEPASAIDPVPTVCPVDDDADIVLIITVPVENVIGYLRPKKLDAKTL